MTRHSTTLSLLLTGFMLFLGSCRPSVRTENANAPEIVYEVSFQEPADDLFHVTVRPKGLSPDNDVYHFASTAPGTYNILDFGRFVRSFKAYDGSGNEIPVEQISTNQWRIGKPDELAFLRYQIEDSFDAGIKENPVSPMSGSGLDSNYAAFNTFAVLGYFEGLQSVPVRMKLSPGSGWVVGTALETDEGGYYVAETYDRLADSPVLAGTLSMAETKVNDIDVDIYVYAVDTTINAQAVLRMANDVLQSAGAFIGESPVPYYKFLFVLLDGPTFQRYGLTSAGALEHSYSSLYVLPVTPASLSNLQSTMAHEFMHILTPLNLHSEVIHSFNFASPTPSEHLWLYEGVTEWVSDIMQLRSGLITTDDYLRQISAKLNVNDNFNKDMSLSAMALEVYTPEGESQFGNIYNRGAVTAAMLDIRLLELSNGTRGLREVFLELLREYGPSKPFPEKRFFDVLVEATYPEIRQFVDDYIRGTKELPYKEYMAKLGFRYIPKQPSEDTRPALGVSITGTREGTLVINSVTEEAKGRGLQEGDVLVRLFGTELNFQNARQVFGTLAEMKIGDEYTAVVRRGEQEVEVKGMLVQRMTYHIFEDMKTLTDRQEFLRERWLKNL